MRKINELVTTALGWWIYFNFYLVISLVVITMILIYKIGLDWHYAFPVFLKWELLVTILAISIALVVHVYKYYVQRVIRFGGFLRLFLLYFAAYSITTVIMAVLSQYFIIAQIQSQELEEFLAFVMIMILIIRSSPQRNINDPEGPTLQVPVDNVTTEKTKPFGTFHGGIDFETDLGTPVYAAGDGKVKAAWPYRGEGNMVKIDHGDKFTSVYAQLSQILVKYGQEVKAGDMIGYVGNTGHSFTPHLHFEVRFKNRTVDPEKYLEDFKAKSKKKNKDSAPKKNQKKSK